MTSNNCKLPNLIIAGVHKAGTTSLYTYLAKHPQICPSFRKEIGFFMPLMFGKEISALDEYAKHFSHCGNERFRMEASPSYFYGKAKVANAIDRLMPGCNIVVILRDPADRLVSFFNRAVSKGTLPEGIDFTDFIAESREKVDSTDHSVIGRGVREGVYVNYISPWQETFGNRLRIVFFDDLEHDAFKLTAEIAGWLGIATDFFHESNFAIENKTTQYRSRSLHMWVRDIYMRNETFWRRHYGLKRAFRGIYNRINADPGKRLASVNGSSTSQLRDFYAPHNIALRAYLEEHGYRDFPSWLQVNKSRAAIGG